MTVRNSHRSAMAQGQAEQARHQTAWELRVGLWVYGSADVRGFRIQGIEQPHCEDLGDSSVTSSGTSQSTAVDS